MSPGILYAVHSLLAVILASGTFAPRTWRRPLLLGVAAMGCSSGIALALGAGSEPVWRSTTLAQPSGIIAGTAVACAWLLAGVLGGERTLGSAALVGLGSSGLLLASLNDWIVPALIFWLASSVALTLLLASGRVRVGALFAVAVSDLALVGALSLYALEERVWTIPGSLEGLSLGLALVAMVVRSGALPAGGVWEALDGAAAPALPLLLGGPLALLGPLVAGAGPWPAVGALIAALMCCLFALVRSELWIAVVGAWPAWLSLGLLLAASGTLRAASIVALLAVTLVGLWPSAQGLGRGERGFLLGLLPATAGFLAIVGTAVLAFEEATEASTFERSAPWGAIVALLPLTVAAGVALGARIARQTQALGGDVLGGWSVRGVFVVGLVLGLAPASLLGLPEATMGDPERSLALNGIALALALVAAFAAHRRAPAGPPVPPDRIEARTGVFLYSQDGADTAVMVGVSLLIGLGSLAAVVYLAIEGLRYGFLPPSNL